MVMDAAEKRLVLEKTRIWFKETISVNHIVNARKLERASTFNINSFLSVYLANFLCGDSSPASIAKALIYPRALGTSITTSFGQNMQSFTNNVLSSFGSTTSGIDIEPSAKDCKNPVESFHANEHEVQNENEEVTRREISRRDGSRGSVG